MADFGQVREGGKPWYIREDLQMMMIGDLRGRIGRISNQQARHLAVGLWSQVQRCYRGLDRSLLADRRSVAQALAWRPNQLLLLLGAMREVSFGSIIMEGPEHMNQYLDSLHPLLALFMPKSSVRRSYDNAARLAVFLEFYINPGQRLPERFVNWIRLLAGVVIALGILAADIVYLSSVESRHPALIFGLAILPILILIVSGREFQAFQRRRTLALFISFTDEFIDDERQYDDPALEDTGW